MVVAVTAGLLAAIEMVAPDALGNIKPLVFGRLRPIHTNLMLLGWVPAALTGGVLYIVPRVLGTKLWSERLGNFSVWAFNALLLLGVVTLGHGMTQGREYAELIRPLDFVVLLWLSLVGTNLLMTVRRRTEKLLFVSVWYACGAVLWTFVVYSFGNVVWDAQGALRGPTDALWLWFYGHNTVGLWLTPLAIACAYWIIPRVTGAPLWSHTLSLVGFWALLAIYTHTGGHHLIQAPVPLWIKVLGVVDSICMLIPVFTFLANVWLPLRERWGRIHADIGGKFVFAGTVFYALTCIQGPLQSLPSIQRVTHFTQWVVAHAHLAVFGFAGMIAMGTIYHVLPLVTGRRIYSRRIADLQYWVMIVGVIGFFLVLTAAGLLQGHAWLNGEMVYRLLPELNIYLVLRGAIGVAVVLGACLQLVNVIMTIRKGEPIAAEPPLGDLGVPLRPLREIPERDGAAAHLDPRPSP
ncbi:MAG: cbb3-type cytochrome c oxidase subunit I [Deltaproteobacteria bacterium]|nr:cbb3-type cytochrome c oxidase subunit I [Deltaproteobacteria bacterium]